MHPVCSVLLPSLLSLSRTHNIERTSVYEHTHLVTQAHTHIRADVHRHLILTIIVPLLI